jgi:peptide/nickel transport system ATP-binding protein
MAEPIIQLKDVDMTFKRGWLLRRAQVQAVVKASLGIREGEILALVGESGCGKTTLGKIMAGLLKPTSGEVLYKGKEIWRMKKEDFQEYRRNAQIVHQDSYAALNPMRTIYHTLSAPFLHYRIAKNRGEAREKVAELLELMGLTPPEEFLDKYPHQLSGGMRQRVVLARAVSLNPKLIVADEPVSMIDVSLRLSILDLMHTLNEKFGIAFLYITHDLATARYFVKGGRIAVMYLGQVVETGRLGEVIGKPRHPYLQALLSAVPVPDPKKAREKRPLPLRSLELPDPTKPPSGCRFHPRCPYTEEICAQEIPTLRPLDGRQIACHLAERIPEWHLL